jgi:hypothetical protein
MPGDPAAVRLRSFQKEADGVGCRPAAEISEFQPANSAAVPVVRKRDLPEMGRRNRI